MGDMALGNPVRTVCQVIDDQGVPARATATNGIWDTDPAVFAKKTENNSITAFTTGEKYFEDFIAACEGAQDEICIIGWQVNWDAQLSPGKRLYDVLLKAAGKGVCIYVMPWQHNNPVQTYDYQTKIVLEEINRKLNLKEAENRVHVLCSASFATENNAYYSHHQKLVVIDRAKAYVGGIDLCYGRYDDATYTLQADAAGRQVMNRYNPCIPGRAPLNEGTGGRAAPTLVNPNLMSGAWDTTGSRVTSERSNHDREQAGIDQGGWQMPYQKAGRIDIILNKPMLDSNTPDLNTLAPACQPRMPWQDVHCRIEGPAVADLMHNFLLRWQASGGRPLKTPPSPSAVAGKGSAHIQVLRSAPTGMRKAERQALGGPERHIEQAMQRLIDKASHFIYLESQFFVSHFGTEVPAPSADLSPAAQFINSWTGQDQNATARKIHLVDSNKRWFGPDAKDLMTPPENGVCQALVARIRRAILNDKRPPFHVYITLPVHPEGSLADASVAVQVYWTMQTIAHGSHSLLNGIRRALKARDLLDAGTAGSPAHAEQLANAIPASELDQEDQRWRDYVTLLNLRNWAKLGERYVTEQIYVHSKLMIVDDCYALLGSANINDRSLLGERDSEIAVLVMDQHSAQADIKGDGRKRPVRQFAHTLRQDIWKKLFGITSGVRPASHLQSAIDAPASPQSWRSIQAQADKNAAAYEAAFPFVPRNWSTDRFGNRTGTAKIIPNWNDKLSNPENSNLLGYPSSPLPFDEKFWSAPQHNPAGVAQLEGVQGFVTALPVHWLEGENVRFEYPTSMVVRNDAPPSAPSRAARSTQMTRADTALAKENA